MCIDMIEYIVCKISMDLLALTAELAHISEEVENTMCRGKWNNGINPSTQ